MIASKRCLLELLTEEDFKGFFGEHVLRHYYSQELGDARSLRAAEMGASCLPFRVRVCQNSIHWYQGKLALRNFDQSEVGVVSERVQKSYFTATQEKE